MTSWASRRSTHCAPPPRRARCAASRGSPHGPRRTSSRPWPARRAGRRLLLHDADGWWPGWSLACASARRAAIEPAGSLRRREPTLATSTCSPPPMNRPRLVTALDGLPGVERSWARDRQVEHHPGRRAPGRLMVCAPAAWGSHLVHFTGSREHNVALRGIALERGLSLSEKGFKVVDTGELQTAHRGGGLRAARPALDRARTARGQRRDPGRARRPPAGARQAHRSAGRHARALGLDRWRRLDRGDGARGPRARPRVDGAHRPLPVAGRDPRTDPGAGRGAARRRSPASTPSSRRSASCTAPRWRSTPTPASTTTTSCSPASTWWWPASTPRAASRPSS